MSQVIPFTTNLQPRDIEQIPQVQPRRAYRFSVDGRAVEVFSTEDGKWHWRMTDRDWWQVGFMDSKPQQFDSYAEAAHDAMDRIRESEEL